MPKRPDEGSLSPILLSRGQVVSSTFAGFLAHECWALRSPCQTAGQPTCALPVRPQPKGATVQS